MPRSMSAQQHYRAFVNSIPSFSNLIGIEARCAAAAEPTPHQHDRMSLTRELAAENISFTYSEGRVAAVRDLSLVIPAGKDVAPVRPSGRRTNKIADILMGLVLPDSGTLKLDGRPLGHEGVRGWRDQIGYVAPDTFLFHDTIRANLKWARPDASEDEMLAALRQASVLDFVAGLKDGLDSIVRDRGLMGSE